MQLEYAGLNGLLVADSLVLATIARLLEREEDARRLEERADALMERIDAVLWNEERGTYLNRHWSGAFEPTLSLTHFYPLLGGGVDPERAAHMLEQYLLSSEHYWTPYVVPNVPRSEASFEQQAYWRGRVWGPTNFLVSEACRRVGRHDIAARIAQNSLQLLLVPWRERGAVCENFNALEGRGRGDNRNDPFYTWGALLAYLSVQQFFDAEVASGSILLGGADALPADRLHNLPFRDARLSFERVESGVRVRSDQGATATHAHALRLEPERLRERVGP